MTCECQDDKPSVSDLVRNHAADNDPETETGESGTADRTELRCGEAILTAPVVKNPTANRETDTSGKDGHEAGPKKTFCVRGDTWFFDATHQQMP